MHPVVSASMKRSTLCCTQDRFLTLLDELCQRRQTCGILCEVSLALALAILPTSLCVLRYIVCFAQGRRSTVDLDLPTMPRRSRSVVHATHVHQTVLGLMTHLQHHAQSSCRRTSNLCLWTCHVRLVLKPEVPQCVSIHLVWAQRTS